LALVINYDLPFETETYVHRIVNDGRFSAEARLFHIFNQKFGRRRCESATFVKPVHVFKEKIQEPSRLDGAVSQKFSRDCVVGAYERFF